MILVVMDFDGTLFDSPMPPSWWTQGYWWGDERSLNPPAVPEHPDLDWWNEDLLTVVRECLDDPDRYCMLLTGRNQGTANFDERIPELLHQQGLDFDSVQLSPTRKTKEWKLAVILEWLVDNNGDTVEIWEDVSKYLVFYITELETLDYKVIPHLIEG